MTAREYLLRLSRLPRLHTPEYYTVQIYDPQGRSLGSHRMLACSGSRAALSGLFWLKLMKNQEGAVALVERENQGVVYDHEKHTAH